MTFPDLEEELTFRFCSFLWDLYLRDNKIYDSEAYASQLENENRAVVGSPNVEGQHEDPRV